jgi:hypothetical protein
VWGLDVTPQDGAQVYSVGQDRTVRLWERGEDLVFVEEERYAQGHVVSVVLNFVEADATELVLGNALWRRRWTGPPRVSWSRLQSQARRW